MRVIVFFDLPMKTPNERKEYASFRKNLIQEGFLMVRNPYMCELLLLENRLAFWKIVLRVLCRVLVWFNR